MAGEAAVKWTSPKLARDVETADDIDDLVADKHEGWRATPAKARRRQRRYKKRLTQELVRWTEDGFEE